MGTTGYQGPQGPAGGSAVRPGHFDLRGMLLAIRTSEPLDSKKVKPGDYFQGTVAQSVYVGNVLAIPRGAQVTGRVVDVKKPGELKGGASIALQLTTLNLGGNSYSLATDTFLTPVARARAVTLPAIRSAAPHWARPSAPLPGVAQALPSARLPAQVLDWVLRQLPQARAAWFLRKPCSPSI
jgi:hypothetical protein